MSKMYRLPLSVFCLMLYPLSPILLSHDKANYDEANVPQYTPLDPLTLLNGSMVSNCSVWTEKRRPELLQLFREHVYGVTPEQPEECLVDVLETDTSALGGLATRIQARLLLKTPEDVDVDLQSRTVAILIYVPNHRLNPCACFVGLNFKGNHTVDDDPNVIIHNEGHANNAKPSPRGVFKERWQIPLLINAGYAVATACYEDFQPDRNGSKHGLLAMFPSLSLQGRTDNFASIGAWAWGMNRLLDVINTMPDSCGIDQNRIVAWGHSRRGKAALWAGALDHRWAMIIPNESGCGGAALSKRCYGETVGFINKAFPHWFCRRFSEYNDNEQALPVDQHLLLSLIAPRPLYVASAQDDQWADPRGEFISAKLASPVYRLFGRVGIPENMKEYTVDKAVCFSIGHHVRRGIHEVTRFDWEQFIRFADEHLKSKPN